ncbi:MAG: 3-phosphoshikimate 1-carboxyvinyltransferase, partial [Candidatus Wallbacteria bacterium]|nr:3-phosphoshikimate 1-carboxyvinyltransferase [Candidatus Wallbacteria bacterium]
GGERLPLAIRGIQLEGFDYEVPEASAQVKTALLLAALKARGTSRITQQTATRDHTERMFAYLQVPLHREGPTLTLRGPIQPVARDIEVPGDPSSAAFFVVAGLLVPGSRVTVRGVCLNPTRLGFVRVLERMGARLAVRATGSAAGEEIGEIAAEATPLRATVVEAAEVPTLVDEVPILAVAASQAEGTTWFRGVQELRSKESDRLAALRHELGALGAGLREEGNDLAVTGPRPLSGAAVESHDDHRMAMALSVAALAAAGTTTVRGHKCVRISFPGFYELLRSMLGE